MNGGSTDVSQVIWVTLYRQTRDGKAVDGLELFNGIKLSVVAVVLNFAGLKFLAVPSTAIDTDRVEGGQPCPGKDLDGGFTDRECRPDTRVIRIHGFGCGAEIE